MLTVIFGAGASYDSYPFLAPVDGTADVRPPLTKDLFLPDSINGPIIEALPPLEHGISRLNQAGDHGVPIEEELAQLQRDADVSPFHGQLLEAARLFLQRSISEKAGAWEKRCSSVTNYGQLLEMIELWRAASGRRVNLVNFNYDLLLDHALVSLTRIPLVAIDWYTSLGPYRYLKPHGSVNWFRQLMGRAELAGDSRAEYMRLQAASILIDEMSHPGENLWGEIEIRDRTWEHVINNQIHVYQPELAIPTTSKADFACPPAHLSHFEDDLGETSHLLVIGWRAQERHFTTRLMTALSGSAVRLLIVDPGSSASGEVAQSLNGLTVNSDDHWRLGFHEVIRERRQELLAWMAS